jgi:hypothetical protein
MKRHLTVMTACVLALAGAPAFSEESPAPARPAPGKAAADPFKGVKKGDRIRVILKTKAEFSGVARKATRDALTIDLYLEERGLDGTMTFRADLVAKVEPLKRWDEKQLAERKADREKRQQEAEAELNRVAAEREAARKADEEAAAKAAAEGTGAGGAEGGAEKSKSDAEAEAAEGIALLKAFPPAEGWGTAPDKTLDWLRSKFAVLGVPLTDAEQRFVDNHALWLKAKEAALNPPAEAPKADEAQGAPAGTPPPAQPPSPSSP